MQGLDGCPQSNDGNENQAEEAIRTKNATTKKGASLRRSRAKATTPEMLDFMSRFFFDYMTVTIKNSIDGTGLKPGLSDVPATQADYNTLARGPTNRPEWLAANEHEAPALEALTDFVVAVGGLYKRSEGESRQGYKVGFQFAAHPTQGKAFLTLKGGHRRNMPAMEISGGNGECARVAPKVREHLGPQLVSRADVSIDISHVGLFEELHKHLAEQSHRLRGVQPPELFGDEERGQTLRWLYHLGDDARGKPRYRNRGVWMRVYQKDLERVASGMINSAAADPHLVRVEFVFVHDEREGKARLGVMSPADMIADHRRSRELVEWLARKCNGLDQDRAVIGLTKIDSPLNDKTAEERAIVGITQYKKPLVDGAIERIVERDFNGDWSAATEKIQAPEIYDETARLVLSELYQHGTVEKRIEHHGLDRVRDEAAQAERLRDQMQSYLARQKASQDAALENLAAEYKRATDGDYRNLNNLRVELSFAKAIYDAKSWGTTSLLRALDRSCEKAIGDSLRSTEERREALSKLGIAR